jgi:HPt (histidine-containing phosphotransfer) domain-containing protein
MVQAHERTSVAQHVTPRRTCAIDYRGTLERFGFDTELFREMVDLFRADAPPRLQRLEAAAQAGDVNTTTFEAHALKGMSASFDARRAVAAALAIELQGRTERRAPDAAAVAELRAAVQEVLMAFDVFAPPVDAPASHSSAAS